MSLKQYLCFSSSLGSFCTKTMCSKSATECPLYIALKNAEMNVYLTTSMLDYQTQYYKVEFPESYGDVLMRKQYKQFSDIATQCQKSTR